MALLRCVCLSLELAPVYYGPVLSSNNRGGEINDFALMKEVGDRGHSSEHRGGSSQITAVAPNPAGFRGDVVRTQLTFEPKVTWPLLSFISH